MNIWNVLKKYLLLIALILMATNAFAYQILQNIPALKGGLNENRLGLCMQAIKKRCKTTRLSVKNATCIQTVLTQRKSDCAQSLAIYQATQGVIQRWRRFDQVTIINTSIPSRFFIGDYFMLTPNGQIIGLISLPLITAQPYATSKLESGLQIWPVAIQLPTAYPSFVGGKNRIVFKQLMTTTCRTCRPKGYAEVAYLFDHNGNYMKWVVQSHKLTVK